MVYSSDSVQLRNILSMIQITGKQLMAYLEDSILNLPSEQAKIFLLKNESYFNGDLPSYFTFKNLLYEIDNIISGKKLSDYLDTKKPNEFDNVNYRIIANKDGKYSWRSLQLMHPAIYVNRGSFTMQGGTISDNSASYGGGVSLDRETFTLAGGTVYGTSTGSDSNTPNSVSRTNPGTGSAVFGANGGYMGATLKGANAQIVGLGGSTTVTLTAPGA
jgi:hypothetical protein